MLVMLYSWKMTAKRDEIKRIQNWMISSRKTKTLIIQLTLYVQGCTSMQGCIEHQNLG